MRTLPIPIREELDRILSNIETFLRRDCGLNKDEVKETLDEVTLLLGEASSLACIKQQQDLKLEQFCTYWVEHNTNKIIDMLDNFTKDDIDCNFYNNVLWLKDRSFQSDATLYRLGIDKMKIRNVTFHAPWFHEADWWGIDVGKIFDYKNGTKSNIWVKKDENPS